MALLNVSVRDCVCKIVRPEREDQVESTEIRSYPEILGNERKINGTQHRISFFSFLTTTISVGRITEKA